MGARRVADVPRSPAARRVVPRPHLRRSPGGHRLLPRRLGRGARRARRRPPGPLVPGRGVSGPGALRAVVARDAGPGRHGHDRRHRPVRDGTGVHVPLQAAPGEVAAWTAAADRTGRAILGDMWDGAVGMFSDVDPATGRRTGVKAAVCFYPYLTDLTGERHAPGLGRHLFDPREFWTPFPVPSSSVDDPLFDPDARWKGTRHNCPWNGRVWPMTNSHVADALARVVRAHRPEWAPRLGVLLRRFARMMTFGGRADRPNCFEHYHPYTGRPSVYRGIHDYEHSWVNDLIVSHVMGVLPHGPTGVTVHPLRVGIERATLAGLPVAGGGHSLRIALDGPRFRVAVDGRAAGRGKIGEPLTIAF